MKKLFILAGLALISISFQADEPNKTETALNVLIDNWHISAAKGDLENYFNVTTDNFVFLGTDPSERWDKETFRAFCKPYFDKGKGWDFKPSQRNWVFSKNKKIAWFDEHLATWMEECRGSGVVVKEGKHWKLAYYNLTVLIENEKTKEFIELRKK